MDKVSQALAQAVVAILTAEPVNVPLSQIVSDNMPKPTGDGAWVQMSFKPAQPAVASLGSGGLDKVPGVFLVNLHYPLNSGGALGLSVLSTFRKTLTAGTRLIFQGQEVQIRSCGGNVGRVVDAWYRADLHIEWVAYLQRGVA